MTTEVAAVDKARAEVRKAQASYDQARLDAETKLRAAVDALRWREGDDTELPPSHVGNY